MVSFRMRSVPQPAFGHQSAMPEKRHLTEFDLLQYQIPERHEWIWEHTALQDQITVTEILFSYNETEIDIKQASDRYMRSKAAV